MNITLKIIEGKGFVEPELKINHMTKVSDMFLVQLPDNINEIKKMKINPISFIANCTLLFDKEDAINLLPKINQCYTMTEEVGKMDVICSFYIDSNGMLSVGTIAELPESLEYIDGEKPHVLIDYGNHMNWCKLSGEPTPTLFQYAKKVILQQNDFVVEEGHFKVGFQ